MDRRTLMTGAAASAAALTMFSPAAAFAAEGDPYLRYVHPELRDVAGKILAEFKDRPPLSAPTLAAQRAEMAKWARPQRSDVPVERKLIAGTASRPPVAIYVINAKPGEAHPAILHTHGGGYVLGTAQGAVTDLQDLCAELGCMAVSVDYRLAPETTYAGSIEDNYAGLKWLHDNAASVGADPARIALMGESAGGGHAAILAQVARDRGQVPVAFQCLVYPMLDDRTGSSVAAPAHVGRIIWTAEANRFGWGSFLGHEPGGPTAPKYAVPARTADLAGLPPAWIGVGGIDLFADEDIAYARRLNAAGVPVELLVVPGAFHGFDGVGAMDPSVRVSGWFNTAKKNALRRGLRLPVL